VNALALGYHDVLSGPDPDSSGFPGPTAARYKLPVPEFGAHLGAIAGAHVHVIADARAPEGLSGGRSLILTFDDGGAGSLAAAECLERHGWKGHFLITAGRIGTKGFLDRDGVRDLRRRGHVVGSHSCTHPERMSVLPPEQQKEEWVKSIGILSGIIGEPVNLASVPGGYYSPGVARAAAASGIRTLFTSEPTARIRSVEGCTVIGRYAVLNGMASAEIAAIARGNFAPRARQSVSWTAKKAAKYIGGENYLKLRRYIISRGTHS
jgi:peptidoglycan/xylan/chitin deacetylase (PgdA/CDA1 family)